MADFDWDAHPDAESAPKAAGGFDWDAHPDGDEIPEAGGETYLDKAGRWAKALISGRAEDRPEELKPLDETMADADQGVLSAISMGFSDEIEGAMESPLGAAKEIANKFGASFDDRDVSDYKTARDSARALDAAAATRSPKAHTVGQVAGALPTLLIPGLNAGKGAKLLETSLRAGAQGGIFGAGASDAEDLAGMVEDTAMGVGFGMGGGAAGYGAGKAIETAAKPVGKALGAIADYVEPPKQRMNAEQIREAAKAMGIEVTPGMLDDSGFIERLESSLAKSPSMFGKKIGKARDAVVSKLRDASQSLTDEASNLSPYQMGERFKSGITADIGERLDPISATFDDVAASTKHIPVSDRSKAAITRNIENIDFYKLTRGEGKPAKYVEMLNRVENADQVKSLMTLLRNDIAGAQGAEKQVLIAIKDKLQNLEKNSIMRGAVQTAREARMRGGEEIGRDIVGDLKRARKDYRLLAKDIGEVGDSARMTMKGGPSQFLDKVEALPSEKIQEKFFNVDNNRQLMALKEKFPEQFELLRTGKLGELRNAGVDNTLAGQGKFSTQRFLNEVRDLNPEAKEMLFPGQGQKLSNIQTVQQSLPRNFNPSGTASELGWHDTLFQNAKDIPNAALYKVLSTNTGRGVATGIGEMIKAAPEAFGKFSSVLQNAAQRGTQSLSATHFILQSSNPEYRDLMRKFQGLEED